MTDVVSFGPIHDAYYADLVSLKTLYSGLKGAHQITIQQWLLAGGQEVRTRAGSSSFTVLDPLFAQPRIMQS